MENTTPKLGIIESDPWLEPYSAAIEGRHQHALDKELELTGGKGTLSDFATGYLYLACISTEEGGCSVNGLRMRRKFILSEISTTGKKMAIIGCIV